MQKLLEASDRKKGRRMRKEKGTSRQKEELFSFSSDQRSDNSLLTRGDATRSSLDDALASPSTSSSRLGCSMPKYKKLRNGRPTKHRTWTNSQKRLARC